jgi:hypothetical protein
VNKKQSWWRNEQKNEYGRDIETGTLSKVNKKQRKIFPFVVIKGYFL